MINLYSDFISILAATLVVELLDFLIFIPNYTPFPHTLLQKKKLTQFKKGSSLKKFRPTEKTPLTTYRDN